ncbi:MAG: amidohydrolase family protein, partial [Firmicutes bacterium]|nr:amidohydrolase family protein [Bacillota bacterium]
TWAERNRTLRAAVGLFEKWEGGAGDTIRVVLAPHAPYTCPPEFLAEVARLSRRLNAPVTIHLSETTREVEECIRRNGKSPVKLALDSGLGDVRLVAAHCVHPVNDDISILSSTSASVAHCPISNLNLGCGIAPVSRMMDAGLTVALGTDGAASGFTNDMFQTMRIAVLAQKHLESDAAALAPARVLWMATRGGALALGLDDCGALRTGMRADLICVATDRPHFQPGLDLAAGLVHCAGPQDVVLTVVNGRVLKKGDRLLVLDEEAVLANARSRAQRLVAGL